MRKSARYRRAPLPTLDELAAWERPVVRTPEDILIERDEAKLLSQALDALPGHDGASLRNWYGIGVEPMTMRDIGDLRGVTGSTVQMNVKRGTRRLFNLLKGKFPERYQRCLDRLRVEKLRITRLQAERMDMSEYREAWRLNEEFDQRKIAREQAAAIARQERNRREIERIADGIEEILDYRPPSRRKSGRPFDMDWRQVSEYAEALKALTMPHYRMR